MLRLLADPVRTGGIARRKFAVYGLRRRAAREADGILASYLKAGRTWTRYALSHYLNAQYGAGLSVDMQSTFSLVPNFDGDPVRGLPAFRRLREGRKDLPLLAVSHLGYRRGRFGHAPVVFMVRDPRDMMVSAYFHATRHKRNFEGGIDAFLASEDLGIPRLLRYYRGWGEGLSRHAHLVLRYEDMKADTAGALGEVIGFLGWPVDEARIAQAAEASAFDRMREQELRTGLPGHSYDRSEESSLRTRKGQVGGFAGHLSPEQANGILEALKAGLPAEAHRRLRLDSYPSG